MGPASPESRIDHTPGKEYFTDNRIHESQTSRRRGWAFKIASKNLQLWCKNGDFVVLAELKSSTQHRKVSNFDTEMTKTGFQDEEERADYMNGFC